MARASIDAHLERAVAYTVFREAPPNRRGKHTGEMEEHFPEASVMLAFALHLLEQGAGQVELRPDGMHGKVFDFLQWLQAQGFDFKSTGGLTNFAGEYHRRNQTILISCVPGVGDVIATVGGRRVLAECKGGIINTRHAGQQSHLRKAVLEAVGQLMCRVQGDDRHVVVVPRADETIKWAKRIGARARRAGIEIALVTREGGIEYCSEPTE